MTLADTSVWIDHLRRGNALLAEMLDQGGVFCHPFVVGELACGRIGNRDELLGLMGALPSAPLADHDEVLELIAVRRLDGRGLGWIDVHLLASALLAGCPVWTFDKPLAAAAVELGIALN